MMRVLVGIVCAVLVVALPQDPPSDLERRLANAERAVELAADEITRLRKKVADANLFLAAASERITALEKVIASRPLNFQELEAKYHSVKNENERLQRMVEKERQLSLPDGRQPEAIPVEMPVEYGTEPLLEAYLYGTVAALRDDHEADVQYLVMLKNVGSFDIGAIDSKLLADLGSDTIHTSNVTAVIPTIKPGGHVWIVYGSRLSSPYGYRSPPHFTVQRLIVQKIVSAR